MLRVFFAVAFFAPMVAAEDEAKPLSEEERVKLVAKWQEMYKKELAAKVATWEKAKLQYAIDPKGAKTDLIQARDAVAFLQANPLRAGEPLTGASKVGDVGELKASAVIVEKIEQGGVLVAAPYQVNVTLGAGGFGGGATAKKTLTVNYLVIDPIPKAKVAARVSLPGVYHVARIDKGVLVVQRVDIKKTELPKKESKQ